MTVSSSSDRATFPGNGATQIFPLPFRFFANSEIQAWLVTNATGVLTPLTLGTHYTLSGAEDPEVDGNPTSELTMLTAPTALQSLFVQRVIPLTQPTDIVNQGRFFPEIHENVFDRLTMLIQQANGEAEGAIRVAVGDPEPTRLAPAVSRANQLMGFDSNGNPIAVAPTSGDASALAMSLANSSDPTKGAGQVGWSRNPLSAAITTAGQMLNSQFVSIWEHAGSATGYNPATDPSTWFWGPALQAAIDACPAGGTVLIPANSHIYNIDTTGGLSASPNVDRSVNLRIDGHLKSNFFALQANPPYMFRVTADNVQVSGGGTVEGDGTANVESAGGSDVIYPGIVYVLGVDSFQWSGVRVLQPPKIGINLRNCTNAIIDRAVFQGGAPTFEFSTLPDGSPNPAYVGSYLVGIVTSGGKGNRFTNLSFLAGDDDGRVTQGIFNGGNSGATNGCVVSGCYADRPWEKLTYFFGDYHRVFGNFVQGPTFTDAFRVWGSFNELYGNVSDLCDAGSQVLDGRQNKVYGNAFLRCSSVGVNVQDLSVSYLSGISLNEVTNNLITWDGVDTGRRFAVRFLGKDNADLTGCRATGNIISGFGFNSSAAIEVTAVSPRNANKCVVKDNFLISCGNGIQITRNVAGVVASNDFYVCSGVAINLTAGGDNEVRENTGATPGTWFLSLDSVTPALRTRWLNNRCTGVTNIGIQNTGGTFSNDNYGMGNQYTAKPLMGLATLDTAASATIVTHGGIASNATIFITPTTAAMGNQVAGGGIFTGISAPDFAVTTANGANPAAGCTFRYHVIQ